MTATTSGSNELLLSERRRKKIETLTIVLPQYVLPNAVINRRLLGIITPLTAVSTPQLGFPLPEMIECDVDCEECHKK